MATQVAQILSSGHHGVCRCWLSMNRMGDVKVVELPCSSYIMCQEVCVGANSLTYMAEGVNCHIAGVGMLK